jgi:hypothetical protein
MIEGMVAVSIAEWNKLREQALGNVTEAIAAERERCAKIVENFEGYGAVDPASLIAAAIRKGE